MYTKLFNIQYTPTNFKFLAKSYIDDNTAVYNFTLKFDTTKQETLNFIEKHKKKDWLFFLHVFYIW